MCVFVYWFIYYFCYPETGWLIGGLLLWLSVSFIVCINIELLEFKKVSLIWKIFAKNYTRKKSLHFGQRSVARLMFIQMLLVLSIWIQNDYVLQDNFSVCIWYTCLDCLFQFKLYFEYTAPSVGSTRITWQDLHIMSYTPKSHILNHFISRHHKTTIIWK